MSETIDAEAATESDERADASAGTAGGGLFDAPATGRRLRVSVGTFVVVGVGFVVTLFFASQFAGAGSGVGAGFLPRLGGTVGFGLAVLLSPLVAVILGLRFGRDGGDRVAVDAGLATGVGFVVMFFATMVVATALGGSADTAAAIGAGPLLGFTLGVALTGAASAVVAATDRSMLASVTDHEFRRPVAFGVGTFLAYVVGFAVAIFLAGSLAQTEGSIGIGIGGTDSVAAALALGLLLSPVVGLLVGQYAGRDVDGDQTRAARRAGSRPPSASSPWSSSSPSSSPSPSRAGWKRDSSRSVRCSGSSSGPVSPAPGPPQ